MSKISSVYLGYDDREFAMAILDKVRGSDNISVVHFRGENFPWAKGFILSRGENINVVILHLMAGCHELGYRECDENYGTGLRRAEILREEGFQGEIILLTYLPESDIRYQYQSLIRKYNDRVTQSRVHFASFHDLQLIVDKVIEISPKN